MIRLLFFLFLLGVSFISTTPGKTLVVQPNGKFKSLATALEAAADYDTIIVKSGKYKTNNLIIEKSVTIIGEGLPVFDAAGKGSVLIVRSSFVTLKGLKIINSEYSFRTDFAGVRLEDVSNCTISDNQFYNNFFGLYLQRTNDIVVTGNNILSFATAQASSGNGIHLWYCKNTIINGNTIAGHRDGIYLEFSSKNDIFGNVAKRNLRYGLHFMFADSSVYYNNKFFKNAAGVAVMYSEFIDMHNNLFFDNKGTSSYGLLLKEIRRSVISGNKFIENTKGIFLEASDKITLKNNLFQKNGWAILLMSNSMENNFERNTFIGNNFDVATNSSQNYNTFTMNYWDNYEGYDLNKDGYGDVPFHPVSLFSVVVTEYKPTLILMRGLFTRLLDIAERVFPSLTPKQLIDEKPAMKRTV
ncbi:MAG: nitrous oxide reductase family maturation protein NosD [Ignavibacteriales bacterium]|nr:MAG: nitrous oxide reductase family maturation protein NosD [Ignavibacteriaceae bacterium]MBW7872081.1 nitrous oxide reductase family maturation protein NosD [Ignavibacteria bacterium]MCZ2143715.1 nitrous oxide reductase family maturation protein NosD [Ignavibacteriales bacterium]OQY77556.1 MAG: hypothetical protein B6D45_02720 [Ignavibacteriales bacterium UTCHB3]MBV6446022.1 putative ABC transporter binding protein NosD [Ignavibacteriaceae bacterium]